MRRKFTIMLLFLILLGYCSFAVNGSIYLSAVTIGDSCAMPIGLVIYCAPPLHQP